MCLKIKVNNIKRANKNEMLHTKLFQIVPKYIANNLVIHIKDY